MICCMSEDESNSGEDSDNSGTKEIGVESSNKDQSERSGSSGDGVQEIGMESSNAEKVVGADNFEGVHDDPVSLLNDIEEAVGEIGIDNPKGQYERAKAEGMQDAVDQMNVILDQLQDRQ